MNPKPVSKAENSRDVLTWHGRATEAFRSFEAPKPLTLNPKP